MTADERTKLIQEAPLGKRKLADFLSLGKGMSYKNALAALKAAHPNTEEADYTRGQEEANDLIRGYGKLN